MIATLAVSQVILGLIVVALAVAVLALARQVGVLHERIAPAGALAVNRRVRVGDPAPTLTLRDIDGQKIQVGGPRDRSQLFFFASPDCPVCKTLLPIVRSAARAEKDWVSVIIASDGGAPELHRSYRDAQGLDDFPYVLSEELGRTFGVSKLPYAVLLDETGKVASLGLVNSREHLESLFEAKDRGVASLQEYIAKRTHANSDEQRIGA
ncbi:MAG: redoxin domain-containing protein [Alphaproteobacteria bacterium]|nr:redoxin domain-containing protein [Alphaproteobacteria bacterium]